MCLIYETRDSTQDIDALFLPKDKIRKAAQKIAKKKQLAHNWLNDAVKGYLGEKSKFHDFLDLENLKVFVPDPKYLLAMKCLAMRTGPEFHDENDIRYLLRYLNIERYEQALKAITAYCPKERFPQKTLYALEEILR